jgi:hypothetical protein
MLVVRQTAEARSFHQHEVDVTRRIADQRVEQLAFPALSAKITGIEYALAAGRDFHGVPAAGLGMVALSA